MGKEDFLIGIAIGVSVTSIFSRVWTDYNVTYYGDKCLNDSTYVIDTLKTYNKNHLEKIEYKFVKK